MWFFLKPDPVFPKASNQDPISDPKNVAGFRIRAHLWWLLTSINTITVIKRSLRSYFKSKLELNSKKVEL